MLTYTWNLLPAFKPDLHVTHTLVNSVQYQVAEAEVHIGLCSLTVRTVSWRLIIK